MNWTELTKSTRLHEALIGHARRRHGSFVLITDAAVKVGRLVLNTTRIPMGLFSPDFAK